MGEQIREGAWLPSQGSVPQDIVEMIEYAASKGIKMLAYVYPCLAFQAVPGAIINGAADLSNMEFQDWMLQTLLDFQRVTKGGGFAWDHNIFAGGPELR